MSLCAAAYLADIPKLFSETLLLNKFPNAYDVALHNSSMLNSCQNTVRVLIRRISKLASRGTKVPCTVTPVPENSLILETLFSSVPLQRPVIPVTGPLRYSHSNNVVKLSLFTPTISSVHYESH